jgi:hypothetical protein
MANEGSFGKPTLTPTPTRKILTRQNKYLTPFKSLTNQTNPNPAIGLNPFRKRNLKGRHNKQERHLTKKEEIGISTVSSRETRKDFQPLQNLNFLKNYQQKENSKQRTC